MSAAMKAINGKGWFVRTLSGLACGDTSFVHTCNRIDVREISETLGHFVSSGFARVSNGWDTMDHPDLGVVQWKSGVDFRTAQDHFFLRLNGRLILRAWPSAGSRRTDVKWVAAPDAVSDWDKKRVERFLGSLQEGSRLPLAERDIG